ncbi:DUF6788 family protein [Thermogemmatispora sp.]|uniref:DUF6788 family protein n=1 Tax=Thermogemmatispora sp. TaxID=1968838 RepID=UPI001DFFEE62|nr:DUF6788 family protein [Thermogemmatispora sp.]MBX5450597.1 hypothetical protein [Thermogemmatispora sp.]
MAQIPSDHHITYQLQYRKCGKPTCSTCREGQGHGPYWYAYWREGSRLRSGYVGKERPAGSSSPEQARKQRPGDQRDERQARRGNTRLSLVPVLS